MDALFQQIVDGVTSGALYGAMALAIVLVYRASGIVNFAQGEMAMFSAFIAWQAHQWGLPLVVSILLSMVAAFAVGAVIEKFLVRPFVGAPTHLPVIIVTLGLLLVFNGAAGWIWGYQTKQVDPVFGAGRVEAVGASISVQTLGTVAAVIVVASLLYVLFQRTRLGLMMRAASSNPESALLSGIPVERMFLIGWGLAAAIGALVGSLAAPQLFLEPNMMAPVLLYGFAAAVVGGLDSPLGAVVGGLLLGVAENLVGTYVGFVGNEFKQSVALVVILLVLLLRPEGLFGKRSVVRV